MKELKNKKGEKILQMKAISPIYRHYQAIKWLIIFILSYFSSDIPH